MKQNELDEIQAWIETLPYADISKTATNIYDYLKALSCDKMSPDDHFAALELFQSPIDYMWRNLRKQFIGKTAMPSVKRPKVVALAQSIEDCYATSYALFIKALLRHQDKHQALHLHGLYRAITHLRRVLLASFLLHAKAPKETWLKASKLFMHANKYQLSQQPVTLPNVDASQTIENAFKHCLLLSTANPFHLDENDIDKVDQALYGWAKHTNITQQENDHALFVMHLNLDQRPQYRKFDSYPKDQDSILFFDTLPLAKHIEKLLKQREEHEIAKDTMTPMPKNLMHYLHGIWNELHTRYQERKAVEGEVNICLGIMGIHYQLTKYHSNEEHPLKVTPRHKSQTEELPPEVPAELKIIDTENSQPPAAIESFEPLATDKPPPPRYDPWDLLADQQKKVKGSTAEEISQYKTYQWQLLDKSEAGFRTLTPSGYFPEAQPGEIVALQENTPNSPSHWLVATICWIKIELDEGTHIGVEILAKSALSATVSILQDNMTPPIKSLVLINPLQKNSENILVIPSTKIEIGQEAILQHPAQEAVIEFTNIICANKYYIQVEYKIINILKEGSTSSAGNTDDPDDRSTIAWQDL